MSYQHTGARSERREGLRIGFGLAVLLAAALWAWILCSGCVAPNPVGDLANLSCVDTNRGIWRSAQPTRAGFARLAAMGVTNSVKLDEDSEGSDSAAHVLGHPISWEEQTVPGLLPSSKINAALWDMFLTRGTVVHCLHGEDRTGLLVACYRVKFQGWTADAAQAEMIRLGFHRELLGLWRAWLEFRERQEVWPGAALSNALFRARAARTEPEATAQAPAAAAAPRALTATLRLGWDCTNLDGIAGFSLWIGDVPGQETNLLADVGLTNAAEVTFPLHPTNSVVCRSYGPAGIYSPPSNQLHCPPWLHVLFSGPGLEARSSLGGRPAPTNSPWTAINPTGQQFFSSAGRTLATNWLQWSEP